MKQKTKLLWSLLNLYIKKLKFSLIFSSYSTLNVGFDLDPVNNSLSVSDKSGSATLYNVQYVRATKQ